MSSVEVLRGGEVAFKGFAGLGELRVGHRVIRGVSQIDLKEKPGGREWWNHLVRRLEQYTQPGVNGRFERQSVFRIPFARLDEDKLFVMREGTEPIESIGVNGIFVVDLETSERPRVECGDEKTRQELTKWVLGVDNLEAVR